MKKHWNRNILMGDPVRFINSMIPKTYEKCLEQVQRTGMLNFISPAFRTIELCQIAIKKDPLQLQYCQQYRKDLLPEAAKVYGLPIEGQTEQSCIEAVKKEGDALVLVEQQTPAICLEAVKRIGTSLRFVEPDLKTYELCLEAVDRLAWALEYVPKNLRTYEMYLHAVNSYGKALKMVPNRMITLELCLIAVKNQGTALDYVPNKFKTYEVCFEAVKENGCAGCE
jgi:hypothetical protein